MVRDQATYTNHLNGMSIMLNRKRIEQMKPGQFCAIIKPALGL